jgi:hypothetical protein
MIYDQLKKLQAIKLTVKDQETFIKVCNIISNELLSAQLIDNSDAYLLQ